MEPLVKQPQETNDQPAEDREQDVRFTGGNGKAGYESCGNDNGGGSAQQPATDRTQRQRNGMIARLSSPPWACSRSSLTPGVRTLHDFNFRRAVVSRMAIKESTQKIINRITMAPTQST